MPSGADRLTATGLQDRLRTRCFGRRAWFYETLPSTQTTAVQAALDGAGAGTLILAESQTEGRGRHGHVWDSPSGVGLYASLVLPPPATPARATLLTLACGLAVADAIGFHTGLEPEMRWPNDLLFAGRKFCGLLLETNWDRDRARYTVLGFGINVRPRSFPPALAGIATALDLHTPRPVDRLALLASVLEELEHRSDEFPLRPAPRLIADVEARCPALRGAEVVVGAERGTPWRGRTEGLDPSGYLLVRRRGGAVERITSGDVRPLGDVRPSGDVRPDVKRAPDRTPA